MSSNNLCSFVNETEGVYDLGQYIQLSPMNTNLGQVVDPSPPVEQQIKSLSPEEYEVYMLLKSWECKEHFISEITS